jgi:hypothetical protein
VTETGLVGSFGDCGLSRWLGFRSVEFFDLAWWPVAQVFMQAVLVEPADVLDDRELELAACLPDAVGDELGLEAVDEALSHRIIVGIASAADRGKDVVIGEGLGVVTTDVLGGFNWSSQRLIEEGCDGQASWVDDGVDGQGADEVAGEAIASSRRGAVVLA